MRLTKSFATTALAGTIVGLMMATGAAPALSPIGRDVAHSYRFAVRAYDRARMWGAIARWWVDPEYVPAVRDEERASRPEDLCQIRPVAGREKI